MNVDSEGNKVIEKINKEQLTCWHEKGYIHIKNVLGKSENDEAIDAVDEIIEKYKLSDAYANRVHKDEYFNILHAISYTDKLDYFLDHSKVFNIITDLMGPFLHVMSCDVFVRHPNVDSQDVMKFHTDGGPSLQKILPTRENIPLQFKVQFFLTDMLNENCSNFTFIPGSHLVRVKENLPTCFIPECNRYTEKGEMPPGAIQLKVNAGDVLIHSWSLWHAIAPNESCNIRKSIAIRYGQMWSKPYYSPIKKNKLAKMTARQRRLVGDFGDDNDRNDIVYRPPEDHVALILGGDAPIKEENKTGRLERP